MCEDTRRPRNCAVDTREVRRAVRYDDIPDALTRQGEGLAVGIADDRVVVKERNAWDGDAVIDDLTIRLIRDDKDRMLIRLLLRAEEIGEAADRRLTVDRTARIIRRVDDDRLRAGAQCPLKCREVDLKIIRLGWHNDELAPACFDKDAILREKGCDGNELVPRLGEGLERDRHRCCRARRHKEILPCDVHAEATLQIGGKRLTHRRFARCNRIAMHRGRIIMSENIYSGIANEVRCGHIGVAKAEVKDILRANLCRTLLPKLKNRTDRGLLRPERIHLF